MSIQDKTGFQEAMSVFEPIGGVVNDTQTSVVSEDHAATARITPSRALHVNVRDNSGNEVGTSSNPNKVILYDSLGNPLDLTSGGQTGVKVMVVGDDDKYVRGVVGEDASIVGGPIMSGGRAHSTTPTAVTSGNTVIGLHDTVGRYRVTLDSGAAQPATTEDTASANGDMLLKIAAVRRDTPVANAEVSADGDYLKFIVDNLGKLWVSNNLTHIAGNAVAAGSGVNGTGVQRVALVTDVGLPAGTNAIGKLAANSGVDIGDVDVGGGLIADDATTPGNPLMIGGQAVETDGTDPTSVSAENDVARCRTDRNRRLLVNDFHPNLWTITPSAYASAQTNATVKAAPGAGLSLYVTDIFVSNGATAGIITLLDGSGGTVVFRAYCDVNGGAVLNLRTPIRLTANTLLAITSTTVTTHSVTISGFTAP